MNLLRADHLGMCFGVRDAIELARHEASNRPVTVLGDLVHNPVVLDDLRSVGTRFENSLDRVTTETVMVTAHGTSDRRRAEVTARGHRMLDATCPLVQVAHRALAGLVERGFHPVVIGQKQHVEVLGLTGDFPGADVILSQEDILNLTPRASFGVVAQTTQPVDRCRALVEALRQRFPGSMVEFRNTVCQPTRQRQSAAESLAQRCDVVVVIGGAHSNNTRELVETCRRHCPRVHHVTTAGDLRPEWFQGFETVGITAGTSTPDSSIHAVEAALQRMASSPVAATALHSDQT
jgi:4-hydroxy-3-methylbut-2-enyl diphosphate reductase